jgi:hypothetical protein
MYARDKDLNKVVIKAVKLGATVHRRTNHVTVRLPDGSSRTISTTRKNGVGKDLALFQKFFRKHKGA